MCSVYVGEGAAYPFIHWYAQKGDGVGSGQWEVCKVGNGHWTVSSGQRGLDSGKRVVDSGEWKVGSGQWTGGLWTLDSGQWRWARGIGQRTV